MLWLIGTLVKGTDIEGHAIRKQSRRKSIVQPFMIFYSLVVHYTAHSNAIDQAMEALPPLATQAFDHLGGGGDGERDQEYKTQKAHGDEGAFDYIGHDLLHVKELVEPDVGHEVQAA